MKTLILLAALSAPITHVRITSYGQVSDVLTAPMSAFTYNAATLTVTVLGDGIYKGNFDE